MPPSASSPRLSPRSPGSDGLTRSSSGPVGKAAAAGGGGGPIERAAELLQVDATALRAALVTSAQRDALAAALYRAAVSHACRLASTRLSGAAATARTSARLGGGGGGGQLLLLELPALATDAAAGGGGGLTQLLGGYANERLQLLAGDALLAAARDLSEVEGLAAPAEGAAAAAELLGTTL